MSHSISGLLGLSLLAIIAVHPAQVHAQRSQQENALPRAAALVDQYREVVSYCAPCGDVAPGIPFQSNGKSRVLMRGQDELMVLVNGRELPAQSTYVRTEAGWFRNLALLLDLPAPGAEPSLRVEHAGTSGELIIAAGEGRKAEGSERERAMPAPRVETTVSPAVPPPAESSLVIVQSRDEGATGLALLALAVSGFATACMLWILLALRIRRRRCMRPRAVDLQP